MPEHAPNSEKLSVLHGDFRPDLCRPEGLADIFEATARRLPDKTALVFGENAISYSELDALAARAASRLSEYGIGAGMIVGLWMSRGIELLAMQLAIAKNGAAWLPFDSETPVDRIQVCLHDCGAAGLLSSASHVALLSELECPVWTAEALGEPLDTPKPGRPPTPQRILIGGI